MTKGKKVTLWLLALALVLSLGLAAAVYAAGPMGMGMGHGHGHGMMNLTPEQAGKLFDLKEKFHTDTVSLRKDLLVKHLEMKALWKAENPDEKAILAKQKELNALKDQMSVKMVTFRLEAKKIAPHAFFGMGHGHGVRYGHGRGLRYGSRRRHGHGPWNGAVSCACCATCKIARLFNPSGLKGHIHGPSATSLDSHFFPVAPPLAEQVCPRISHNFVINAPRSPYSAQVLPISLPTAGSVLEKSLVLP